MKQPWTKLFFAYGFLTFSRLRVENISVDVSLCSKELPSSAHHDNNNPVGWYMNTDGGVGKAAAEYGAMLEKRMRRSWSVEIRVEINKLREGYVSAQREAYSRAISPTL